MSLSPLSQEIVASTGTSYACPAEHHLRVRMENTRTCNRQDSTTTLHTQLSLLICRSTRQEEFTNMSLDLVPWRFCRTDPPVLVYFSPTYAARVEFRRENGGNRLGQRSTFTNLPT